MVRARHSLVCLVIIACGFCGCIQQPKSEPLTNARAVALLDEVIFNPGISCAELRDVFGVDYLPLAETPADMGLDYDQFYVTTFDNNALRSWFIPALQERGVVLLSTGAAGTMPCYMYTIRILVANGWSVMLYDYRGFGGSSGYPKITALAADLEAMVDWTRAYTGREKITLMGISLGSVPSVAIAAKRPDEINGVILDSAVVLSMEAQRVARFLGDIGNQVAALLPNELRSEDLIESVTAPVLYFQNEEDLLTPPAMVQLLYDRTSSDKTIIRFDGVGHARGVFRETETYAIALETFLVKIWENGATERVIVVP